MLRRQSVPQYQACADALLAGPLADMPEEFNVRMLAERIKMYQPSMITSALRHLEERGIVHAPGTKTFHGAIGRRRVAVMVWRKGAGDGTRTIARRGGGTHVPPSVALKRMCLPSPHDKAGELQLCVVHGIPLENVADKGERPVLYVPRAWLDDRAPELPIDPPPPPAAAEAQNAASEPAAAAPVDQQVLFRLIAIEGYLARLVAIEERRPLNGTLFT